ncbi:hypothetical protein [Mesorhizobium sp. IMUNJ 23232]|uniref:hypothetical protein n=1 Tax=Mesorhizobium sp. IMUNJ 23232 TaxID=3376064 RepID=UPI0037AA6EF8
MSDMKTSLKRIDIPQIDVGAPSPLVLAEENRLLFGYYLQTRAAGEPFDSCAIVSVGTYLALKFGYPNDEALGGHRYAPIGLRPYSAYEVLESEWIREMKEANWVHPHHTDRMFAYDRHFIFTFHDSVLEFVSSDDLAVSRSRGDLRELICAEACQRASVQRAETTRIAEELADRRGPHRGADGSRGTEKKHRGSGALGKLLQTLGLR